MPDQNHIGAGPMKNQILSTHFDQESLPISPSFRRVHIFEEPARYVVVGAEWSGNPLSFRTEYAPEEVGSLIGAAPGLYTLSARRMNNRYKYCIDFSAYDAYRQKAADALFDAEDYFNKLRHMHQEFNLRTKTAEQKIGLNLALTENYLRRRFCDFISGNDDFWKKFTRDLINVMAPMILELRGRTGTEPEKPVIVDHAYRPPNRPDTPSPAHPACPT